MNESFFNQPPHEEYEENQIDGFSMNELNKYYKRLSEVRNLLKEKILKRSKLKKDPDEQFVEIVSKELESKIIELKNEEDQLNDLIRVMETEKNVILKDLFRGNTPVDDKGQDQKH